MTELDVFLSVVLVGDNAKMLDFYQPMDQWVSELGGIDVIQNLSQEQKQIKRLQNDFFVYSRHVHVARM